MILQMEMSLVIEILLIKLIMKMVEFNQLLRFLEIQVQNSVLFFRDHSNKMKYNIKKEFQQSSE